MGDLAEIRDNAARYRALRKFVEERVRQDQNHSPEIWALILTEEVGEVAKAALPAYCGGEDITAFRKEVIQCGAVCLAILESLDRQRL
jgi:NTP pyrophosphatase (non-canonical NTP hydrolase)